jgi:hypothetical protein
MINIDDGGSDLTDRLIIRYDDIMFSFGRQESNFLDGSRVKDSARFSEGVG